MKNKNNEVDILLKRALKSSEKPDSKLIQKVKYDIMREEPNMKKSTLIKRSFSTVAAAIMALVIISTTAFAAWYFIKPSDIADKFEDKALSAAFKSETAININSSVTSNDYIFTLLAVVSGKDISDLPYYSSEVYDERMYAVVAIQNADGTPMPSAQDDDYGKTTFFASPLVKGLKPWQVNAFTLNGGYSETVVDGIMYRMVECDNVAMFADRGLYFAVSTSMTYDTNAFIYNEQTGEITVNKDYDGSSAIFNLPIDKKLADPEKAEQYLNDLYAPSNDADASDEEDIFSNIDWDKALPVESTAKELTVGANGEINYTYDFEHGSGNLTTLFDECFEDNKTPQSKIVSMAASDDSVFAIRFSMDEKGIITGVVVMPE